MDRYSFGTFLVEDFNRSAHQACRDIADLENHLPQPVVLAGDAGCGKTHLLYAIVNRVRAASPNAGIAYISADNFPEEVRNLIADPTPLEDAEHAVLLVDDLDRFTRNQENLEGVIHAFLINGHAVVTATRLHPARIQHLSDSLRQTLMDGELITLLPREAHRDAFGTPNLTEDDAPSSTAAKDDSLLLELRSELEHERGENALLAVAQKEVIPLREKLRRVEAERDQLESELRTRAADPVGGESPYAVREDARLLLRRAEALLEAMQKNRLDINDAQRKQVTQLEEIRSLEHTLRVPVGASAVIHALDAQLVELVETTENLRGGIVELFTQSEFDSDEGHRWSSTSSCPELVQALPAFAAHLCEERTDLMENVTESADQLEEARREAQHFANLVEERDIMLSDLKSSMDQLEVEAERMVQAANTRVSELSQTLEAQKRESEKYREEHQDVVSTLASLLSTLGHSSEPHPDSAAHQEEDVAEDPPDAPVASNITSFEEIAALAEAIDTVDTEQPVVEATPDEPESFVETPDTTESDDAASDSNMQSALSQDDPAVSPISQPENTVHFDDSRYLSDGPSTPTLHHVEELEKGLNVLPDEMHGTESSDQKNQTA